MKNAKDAWLALPLGSGVVGASSTIWLHLSTDHTNTLLVVSTCALAALATIAATIVAIVRIRTSEPSEKRRTAKITRIAAKHPDRDRAMRLLMIDKYLDKAEHPTAEQMMDLLGSDPAQGKPVADDLFELVRRADEGQDVVPPHPPKVDGQSDAHPDLEADHRQAG
jgi:hypothetical protein